MIAAYTGWIDSRNDPKKAVQLGDGTPVDAAAMDVSNARTHDVFRWDGVDGVDGVGCALMGWDRVG